MSYEEKLMHLVQIFLPLKDNAKNNFDTALFAQVQDELIQKFGGLTAFLQNPAKGTWIEKNQQVSQDDIVVVEVMTQAIDRAWWAAYRKKLEKRFLQDTIVMRTSTIELL